MSPQDAPERYAGAEAGGRRGAGPEAGPGARRPSERDFDRDVAPDVDRGPRIGPRTVEPPSAIERAAAWSRRHRRAVDVGTTALLALFLVVPAGASTGASGSAPWLLSLLLVAPLAWRRTAPRVTFALVVLAGLLVLLVGDSRVPGLVAVLITVHAVTAYGTRRDGRLVLVTGLLASGAAGARFALLPDGALVLSNDPVAAVAITGALCLLVVAAWSIGQLSRVRVSHEAALTERARLLEAERDQQAVIAAAAERARIAREMHDVVAHSLAVVVAQADGGRYAARADPAAAVRALETIAGTGRQALADMRGLLGVLREDGAARRTPQPGAGDLADLVEDLRAGGLDVRLEEHGERRPLPPSPGLAVHRIAQESLTNVLKHAGPRASAVVRVRWLEGAVALEVLDDGRGAGAAPAPPGGQGLVGMRERAALTGGSVEAGPAPGGGWRVRALVPDEPPAADRAGAAATARAGARR
ncbi:histidine kinase [Pseudokineococcus sp. 5B2Z-1]|uniref:sensor histidine kinase n=1 Tax=Pseudokineococcus sp. 5B2Z-1 TaxID=3132744 RepID=UPI0030AD8BC1